MKKTIQFLLLSIPMLFMACGIENNKNQNKSEAEMEILRHLKEVEWPSAYANQDTLLLDRILAEDFIMIDQVGNWYSKKDELEWIKKNTTQNDSFHYEIKRFDILENGTALICGTGHILKDSMSSIYQSSNVFVKQDGKWKAVQSHVSGYREIK